MEPQVNEVMNQQLLQDFSEDEIKMAIFQMNPLGALGLNEFLAIFY